MDIRNDIARWEGYYKRYKSSHSHDVVVNFKSLKNLIVSKIRTAKKEFFENLASSINDTKKFWSTIWPIQPRVDFSSGSLSNGSTTVSDNSNKATMLNTFFASCFNQTFVLISYQIPSTSTCRPELDEFECVPKEVCILFKNHSSAGPDAITAWMLQTFAEEVAPSVASLSNLSIKLEKSLLTGHCQTSSQSPKIALSMMSDPAGQFPFSQSSVKSLKNIYTT